MNGVFDWFDAEPFAGCKRSRPNAAQAIERTEFQGAETISHRVHDDLLHAELWRI